MWYDTRAPISLIHPFVQAAHLCYQLFEQWPQRRFAATSRVKDQAAEDYALPPYTSRDAMGTKALSIA